MIFGLCAAARPRKSVLLTQNTSVDVASRVHLQVLLGAGLALLCFCLLLGCAICWQRSRRRQSSLNIISGDKDLAQQREHEHADTPVMSAAVPIPLQYQDMDGDITPKSGEDIPIEQDLMPIRSLHSRASLPSLYQLSSKTKRAIQRRSTIFSECSPGGDRAKLVRIPLSRTEPSGLSGVKQKSLPLLHFALCYSLDEEMLTVTVTGLTNLPKRFHQKRDSWVKAYLLPGFIEPSSGQKEGPDDGQKFCFCRYSPQELRDLTLRLAVYARERNNLKEGFIGEVLFSCAHVNWQGQETSGHTKEVSIAKTKLKKSLSTMDVLCAPATHAKSLGKIYILLQYQMLANRIKVMVQKAENLGKLTRIPGAADHFVSIRLIHNGQLKEMKETRSVSGSSPVWNAPFLFVAPPGAMQDQTLCLEFLVMQGRIYSRGRILGRVIIGAGATEAGLAHWEEMCFKGPMECARWHALQPDVF
ncbi:synaptotagmin-4-like [Spea bombifrons]|uniref:synaptotagmin-4-like n=1 Tax=Spea bombifrons TaxID=233779 RepID=UPI00234B835D|nr:synaptotagmin-4-like [Spea bombifrons]